VPYKDVAGFVYSVDMLDGRDLGAAGWKAASDVDKNEEQLE